MPMGLVCKVIPTLLHQQITVSDEEGSLQWTEKMVSVFSGHLILKDGYFLKGQSPRRRIKMSDVVGERLRAMQETGQIPAN